MIRKTTVLTLASTFACASSELNIDQLHMNVFKQEVDVLSSTGASEAKTQKAAPMTWRGATFDTETAYADKQSADWVAVSAMIGTLLWLWSMLYYGKTQYSDATMLYNQPPIAWFWSHMASYTLGWTAASYLAYFITYFFVSVIEFAAWCMYISGDGWFYGLWSQYAGWTAFVTYMLPPLFATFNLAFPVANGGIATHESNGFVNAVMLACVGWANWLFQTVVHFVFMYRLNDHVQAKDIVSLRNYCKCEKASGSAADFAAAHSACFSTLQKFRCQELTMNALYDACEGKSATCKKETITTCLNKYEVKEEGARMLVDAVKKIEIQTTRYNNKQVDDWTKCKAYKLVGYPAAGTEVW